MGQAESLKGGYKQEALIPFSSSAKLSCTVVRKTVGSQTQVRYVMPLVSRILLAVNALCRRRYRADFEHARARPTDLVLCDLERKLTLQSSAARLVRSTTTWLSIQPMIICSSTG